VFVFVALTRMNHVSARKRLSLECMISSRLLLLRTASESTYALLVLITIVATGLSCAALLSQAVRTAPNKSWAKNVNALVIGASYAVVVSQYPLNPDVPSL
jgi:hypothetical protein